MWHDGATYGNGPCNVPGSTSYGRGDLTYLDACEEEEVVDLAAPCTAWKQVASMLENDHRIRSHTEKSLFGDYRVRNADASHALYIKDFDAEFKGVHYWASLDRASVQCATSVSGPWRSTGWDTLDCDENGVGEHDCGEDNGWVLWRNGSSYGNGPCNVRGATSNTSGDLVYLDACMSKKKQDTRSPLLKLLQTPFFHTSTNTIQKRLRGARDETVPLLISAIDAI
jgi:hypothetical protein